MAVSQDPNDPNFGLEMDDTSPNFGLPEQQEAPQPSGFQQGLETAQKVVSTGQEGLMALYRGPGQTLNRMMFPEQHEWETKPLISTEAVQPIRKALQYPVQTLSQIVTGEEFKEPFPEKLGEFASEQISGQTSPEALGLLAAGGIVGKMPKIREIAFGKPPPVTPEAITQTPEPLVSEVARQETQPIPETIKPTEEVIPSAIKEGEITEGGVAKHPGDVEGGPPAQTSRGSGVEPSPEIQRQQEVVEPVPQPEQPIQEKPLIQPEKPLTPEPIDGTPEMARVQPEQIVEAAFRTPSGEIIRTGGLHGQPEGHGLPKDSEAGFMTNSGRFVGREEAGKIATGHEQDLFGEDFVNHPEIARGGGVYSGLQPEPPPATPPVIKTPSAETPAQKPSKIGKSIEAKAVEAKLTEGFSETAGYDPIKIADQAERATSFVRDSPTDARAVIRGDASLPEGLKGTSIITAMEEQLLRKPDAQLAYELANSPLVKSTSEAAQELRLMSERVPDSITAKFAEIQEARRAGSKLRGETPERLFQDIRQEIVRQSSKRPTWEAFVREITC